MFWEECSGGAGAAPFKKDLRVYLDFVIRKLYENKNITVRMGTEATPEMLDKEGFDACLIGIGNVPFFPGWITCKDPDRVVPIHKIDSGEAQAGQNIVIVVQELQDWRQRFDICSLEEKLQ